VEATSFYSFAMSWDGWNPDMVVGIDFGMTCTGMKTKSSLTWAENVL
jgi:hypothetical protein